MLPSPSEVEALVGNLISCRVGQLPILLNVKTIPRTARRPRAARKRPLGREVIIVFEHREVR